MKKYILTLMLPMTIVSARLSAAELMSEAPLASPYFVDELHCSGVNSATIEEGWLISKDEVEPAKRIEQQDMCERVLRVFGITKFMWSSPDDLERTATIIRQSGYFKDSELSIRKSELQNHVHVFLKVTPGQKYTSSIEDNFKFFSPKGQSSSRIYDHFSGEVSNRKYSPVTINTFGVNLMGTSASAALSTDAGVLTDDDNQKFDKRNAYFVEAYWKNQGNMAKNVSYDIGFHLIDDDTYSDNHGRLNFQFDGDLLFNRQVNIVHGTAFIGPAFIVASYLPYQVPQNKNNTNTALFGGAKTGYNYGQEFGNNLNFALSYYHASGDQSIYDFDLNLQRHLSFLDSYLLLGFKNRIVNDAVLVEDRFPLSGANDSNEYIGFGEVFRGAEINQEISLLLGTENLQYAANSSGSAPSFDVNSAYVGINYKLSSAAWNVKVGLDYYFQRLY